MDDLAALREALEFFDGIGGDHTDVLKAAAQEYLRLMQPPVRCDVCDGTGWLDTYEPCGSCHGGWVGEARWHCTVRTGIQVCNPDRTGGGHHGCGWYVPIVHR